MKESTMKPFPWLRALLFASLALNLGVIAALALRPAPVAPPPSLNLPEHLALTPEQRTRWAALETPFLEALSTNWEGIRHHREALVRHIFAATPDRAAIDAEQTAIAHLQDEQQQLVIAQLLAERAVLNDQQRTQLLQLLLGRYAQEATEEELLHRK